MNSYKYITKRYGVDSSATSPIKLPFGRNELAGLFRELNFKSGAEIGVEKGMYSAKLCEENPDAKIYGIDSWRVYKKYKEEHPQRWFDERRYFAKRRMKHFNNYEIIEKYSMDAVKDFSPGDLDFVYIDANHRFKYVLEDIAGWSKIVRKGGIVAGHDYLDTKKMHLGVVKAVDEYVKKHNKTLFLLFLKHGEKSWLRDSSWFFVN